MRLYVCLELFITLPIQSCSSVIHFPHLLSLLTFIYLSPICSFILLFLYTSEFTPFVINQPINQSIRLRIQPFSKPTYLIINLPLYVFTYLHGTSFKRMYIHLHLLIQQINKSIQPLPPSICPSTCISTPQANSLYFPSFSTFSLSLYYLANIFIALICSFQFINPYTHHVSFIKCFFHLSVRVDRCIHPFIPFNQCIVLRSVNSFISFSI